MIGRGKIRRTMELKELERDGTNHGRDIALWRTGRKMKNGDSEKKVEGSKLE